MYVCMYVCMYVYMNVYCGAHMLTSAPEHDSIYIFSINYYIIWCKGYSHFNKVRKLLSIFSSANVCIF